MCIQQPLRWYEDIPRFPVFDGAAHIEAGSVRALAVGSLARYPQLPKVPTVAESGFPDFEAIQWVGLLTTAGHLLFGNDGQSNFDAFDAATGKILWHTWMPTLTSNGAQTYLVDGLQMVVVAANDTVYAFTLNR